MANTLTYLTTELTLPVDLVWTDEHTWSPVEQAEETSVTGAAIIDVAAKTDGRPITLEGDENHAWIDFATVAQLKAWAAVPGRQLSLRIRGTTYNVLFRHQDKPAMDIRAVVDYANIENTDFYYGALKFIEV